MIDCIVDMILFFSAKTSRVGTGDALLHGISSHWIVSVLLVIHSRKQNYTQV